MNAMLAVVEQSTQPRKGEIVLYQPDENTRLEVRVDDETVWLTTIQMSQLFNREDSNIRRHIIKIFSDGELPKENNVHFLHVIGVKKPVPFYVNASRDLRAELGINKGFSESTMRYATRFYELYSPLFSILQQGAEELQMTDNERITNRQQPAIGLLICKGKNTILARYAIQGLSNPIGIADYEVTTKELPKELQGHIPTCQELEYVLTQNSPFLPQ